MGSEAVARAERRETKRALGRHLEAFAADYLARVDPLVKGLADLQLALEGLQEQTKLLDEQREGQRRRIVELERLQDLLTIQADRIEARQVRSFLGRLKYLVTGR